MRLKKYGITLTRLKEDDIELVRVKRNSSNINSLMHLRRKISPKMQKEWFKSINNIYNNYFIVHYNGEKIGLINGKNSDYKKRQSEGGMFIWNEKYWGTVIPAMCSVMLSDFTFFVNHFERNYIKILNSNANAISYNKRLGYLKTKDFPADDETHWYALTKEDYLKNIEKIRKGIQLITADAAPLSIKDIDFNDDSDDDLLLLYAPLPGYVKSNVNKILKRDGRMKL